MDSSRQIVLCWEKTHWWLAGQRCVLLTCVFFFVSLSPPLSDASPHEPPLALNHRKKLFFMRGFKSDTDYSFRLESCHNEI